MLTLDEIKFSGLCLCGKNKGWGHVLCAPCKKKLGFDETDKLKVELVLKQYEKQRTK